MFEPVLANRYPPYTPWKLWMVSGLRFVYVQGRKLSFYIDSADVDGFWGHYQGKSYTPLVHSSFNASNSKES